MATTIFQETFVSSIAGVTFHAYTSGLLQYYPLVVADITVSMVMASNFNTLSFSFAGRSVSISMYDNDSEFAQLSSIEALIVDIVAAPQAIVKYNPTYFKYDVCIAGRAVASSVSEVNARLLCDLWQKDIE